MASLLRLTLLGWYVRESTGPGATMVDISGYSSRPGATFISPEEKLSRILSFLQALRNSDILRSYKDPTDPHPAGITERVIDTPTR